MAWRGPRDITAPPGGDRDFPRFAAGRRPPAAHARRRGQGFDGRSHPWPGGGRRLVRRSRAGPRIGAGRMAGPSGMPRRPQAGEAAQAGGGGDGRKMGRVRAAAARRSLAHPASCRCAACPPRRACRAPAAARGRRRPPCAAQSCVPRAILPPQRPDGHATVIAYGAIMRAAGDPPATSAISPGRIPPPRGATVKPPSPRRH